MDKLLKDTAAYKIFCGDLRAERLSHAYMLYFPDRANLREALKIFALAFFNAEDGDRVHKLVLSEGYCDLKIYPLNGGNLTADNAAQIVADSAIKPLEGDKKLYLISAFDSASPIFQNKLLKVLEEPPEGVHFILGAASLPPVLATVKSRVKLLEIPPFSEEEIYGALQREGPNALNRRAASSCGGILGNAQEMIRGEWYKEVSSAAAEICSASTLAKATQAAQKYGETKYKTQLLAEMQRVYFGELKKYAVDPAYRGALSAGAVSYAANAIGEAMRNVKLNANFSMLLLNLLLRIASENKR